MPTVQERLGSWLEGATRVAVLAVGSRLRGDDVAGLLTAVHLKRQLAKRGMHAEAHFVPRGCMGRSRMGRRSAEEARGTLKREFRAVLILNGDTAPENMTGQIKDFKPSHLIILDAADTGREVGHIDLVDPAGLSSNLSASTHSLPIKMVIEYIDHYVPCKCTLAGIQPRSVHFGGAVTPVVSAAARALGGILAQVLAP
jgi:hydrogenase 3 maturation protease